MEIIIGRQGTQKLTITELTVSRKHCKVTPNGDNTYTIENLSSQGTKVDGVSIVKTTSATLDSVLELGPLFKATLRNLLNPASAGQPANAAARGSVTSANKNVAKIYNIAHLQKIWDDYNNANILNAEKQRKINMTRTGLGIFTMCAMPTIFLIGPIGYVLTGIGILGNVFSFVGMKNSETALQRQKRQEEFDDAWVCPNPECGRTLPAKNYKMLVKNHQSCIFCKCKYVEKK